MATARTEAAEIAQHCLGSRARRLERVLTRIYDGALRDRGITSAQLGLLVAIELAGPTTAAWLGRRLELEKSTVSRNLARLQTAGLVASTDGLRTTPRGSALIQVCHPLWQAAQHQAEAALGATATRLLRTTERSQAARTGTRHHAEKANEPR